MKIAIWHNLPSGGGKRALHAHIQGLRARGHEMTAWRPSIASDTYLPVSDLIPENVRDFAWNPNRPAGRLAEFYWWHQRLGRQIRAMEQHCRQVAQEIDAGSFDVVFMNSCFCFGTAPLARYVQTPVVLYLQEPFRALYEPMPTLAWLAQPPEPNSSPMEMAVSHIRARHARIQARYEWANARAPRRILVNSAFSRESIARAYGLDSTVCYLGVDTQHFQPTGEPAENYVVGMGSVTYSKGVDRAIRALAAIPKPRRPDLVWIGNMSDTKYHTQMQELAAQLDVNWVARVNISDAEVISTLSRAALLVYTSRLEPFGYAPLEANACGTPVVAIAEGGVRETVQEGVNGLLTLNDDPAGLGCAILQLLESPEHARQMGMRARQQVEQNWTISRATQELETHLMRDMAEADGAQTAMPRNSTGQAP